jgi:threonine synthase
VQYVSTRGKAPTLPFEGVLLAGLARDGGLYLPSAWPVLAPEQIASLANRDYRDVAFEVMQPFLAGDDCLADLKPVIEEAYAEFAHPAITPLRQLSSSTWLLELFHGPTLAFKDLAMQIVARLMDRSLIRARSHATVVGATSGDTGAAAIEAFRGREAIDIFILHPQGRVTDVQRRQMTTVGEPNVHNIAIEGNFDDCQAIVKALFNDLALRDRLRLTGVNSINWGRILAQVVYYFAAGVALGAPYRPVSFTVPTGNFGDIFAGYVAREMGLPVQRLVIATNANDSLPRAFATGLYEPGSVIATSSPSMDIQLASNFERLLFELVDRDADRVAAMMEQLRQTGKLQMPPEQLNRMKQVFAAYSIPEERVSETIGQVWRQTGMLIDPHTAVAIAAALDDRHHPDGSASAAPMIVLSTADAAKFPQAVKQATGQDPVQPERLKVRLGEKEHVSVLPADIAAVSEFIAARARAEAHA